MLTIKYVVEKYWLLIVLGSVFFIGGCQDKLSESSASNQYVAPVLFNSDWQFINSDIDRSWAAIKNETLWMPVDLPHTTRIEPKVVNNQWQGFAWYRKKITADKSWNQKKIYVDFEAAMNTAEVWLNDKKLGSHLGGYLPFSVELPANLVGENWLYVKLDNRDNAITGPKPLKLLDFNTYGGIYRNVWLRLENTTHITDAVAANKTASGGVFVTYPKVTETESFVQVKTHLVSANNNLLEIKQNLYFGDELVTSVKQSVSGNSDEIENTQTLIVKQPKLWSPSTPHLYKLETLVMDAGVVIDKKVTRIGIREFKFQHNQLYINGKKTFLRGVNRHQEYPYVGYALSDAAQYRDAEKIKAAGFDYIRLSHYPHATAFMDAADELGLVLLDSILGWQYVSEDPEFQNQVVQTCRDMIRRDRNHPSVLAWECSLNESWMKESLIDRFTQAVHEEYPGENVYSAGWQEYGYDIYLQARQHRIEHYKTPEKPYMVSEYGDWEYYAMNAGLNQDKWQNLLQAERSSRQLLTDGEIRLQQQARNLVEAHNDNFNTPAFGDGYWVMFDYNRGYADDLEASGIMSIDRLPKFSYYFFQSQRDANDFAGPLAGGYMVHLATYWQKDSSLTVPVFSNAEKIEIYLNGEQLGEALASETEAKYLRYPPKFFTFPKFVAGEIKAVAYAKGKKVAEHRIVTPGEPVALQLALDKSSIPPQADRNDVIFVRATLVDAAGNHSRINLGEVQFGVEGDASLLSPAKVLTENGTATSLLQLGSDLSKIKIRAQYKNIRADAISLDI